MKKLLSYLLFTILLSFNAYSTTWEVGADKTYTLPSQIMSLVQDGDTILIYDGEYLGDVGVWNKNNLVIKGIGNPHLMANGQNAQGKAIWITTGDSIYIENIEFSGATVPDKNGAGIRAEGLNLTISKCYFHDNENGILVSNNPDINIFVEFSEFGNNGAGDGYSHSIYVGHNHSFTMQYCYFHHAKVGHHVKSRAQNNFIKYNYITDEEDGNSSSIIDLPNGGFSIIIGNILFQGSKAENGRLISYGLEGLSNTYNKLRVINNTLISERHTAIFLMIDPNATNVQIVNNLLIGKGEILQGPGTKINNIYFENKDEAHLIDYDNQNYAPLKSSTVVDKSIDAGILDGIILTPTSEYVHPVSGQLRGQYGVIDIGALEHQWPVSNSDITSSKLSISPNPFHDFTTISLKDNNSNSANLQIFNAVGQLIRAETVDGNEIIVNRNGLENGVYFIRITQDRQVYSGVMVVE